MSNSSVIIIASRDVEGMVCAAQIMRKENRQCQVVLAEPGYCSSHLNPIYYRDQLPEAFYVANIEACVSSHYDARVLVKEGAVITWVDNHVWPERIVASMEGACTLLLHNSPPSRTSITLARWADLTDPYYIQMANIPTAVSDSEEWATMWYRLLTSHMAHLKPELLDRLAQGATFDQDDLKAIDNVIGWEKAKAEMKSRKPSRVKISDRRTMAVYDLSNYPLFDMPGFFLSQYEFSRSKAEVCLIRTGELCWHAVRRPGSEYELRHLGGIVTSGDMQLQQNGRGDYLIIRVMKPPKYRDVHEAVIYYMHWYLGAQSADWLF